MKPARDQGGDGLEDVDAQLQRLLDAYGAFLRAAVRRLCPRSLGVAAEEVEQDARIRLWQALRRERNITDPASYVHRIAATAAIDAATSHLAAGVRRGTYYVRMRARNACGSSPPSNETVVVVP